MVGDGRQAAEAVARLEGQVHCHELLVAVLGQELNEDGLAAPSDERVRKASDARFGAVDRHGSISGQRHTAFRSPVRAFQDTPRGLTAQRHSPSAPVAWMADARDNPPLPGRGGPPRGAPKQGDNMSELSDVPVGGLKLPWRPIWWPWLLAPAAAGVLAAAAAWGVDTHAAQAFLDDRAPVLLAAALLIYLSRLAVAANPLHVVMAVFTAALFCRENRDIFPFNWHNWAQKGILYILAAIALWAAAWRKRLAGPLRDRRHTCWLAATVWTYFVAFLVYKRAFKFIPGEPHLHNYFEEGLETLAHFMLVLTASFASFGQAEVGREDQRPRQKGS